MKGDNYSNQNIYNTTAGQHMAVSQDKSIKVEVKDVDPMTDYKWVETNNGSCKSITINGIELRYNKSYNYWTTREGNLLTLEDGVWIEHHPWKRGVSAINGYKRNNERYYYQIESNHPNFKGKFVFVHHIMAYVWIDKPGRGSYDKGRTIVDHMDGDSLNNHADNLQYLTKEENIAKYKRGEH